MRAEKGTNFAPSFGWRLSSWLFGVDRVHRLQGGLANQMFQYAHAWALQRRWPARTFTDLSRYAEATPDRAYRVEQVFEMQDHFPILSASASRHIKRWGLDRSNRSEELTIEFKESYLAHDLRGIVQGYFPSFKYSTEVQDIVRKNFRFKLGLPSRNHRLAEELMRDEAVAVHVRRGDYLNPENKADFSGICTPAYYRAAIEHIRLRRESSRFYFFSDDPAWCRAEFADVAHHVVEGNVGEDSWADMALMTRSRSAIIANSSYSLWARWLAAPKDGINIGPCRFLNGNAYGARTEDILPESFIRFSDRGEVVPSNSHSDLP